MDARASAISRMAAGKSRVGAGCYTWIPFQQTEPATGFVANEILLFDYDASDFDQGQYLADSQVEFWFTPP